MRQIFTAVDTFISLAIDAICIGSPPDYFLDHTSRCHAPRQLGSPAWSDEIVEFMLAWLIFIGAAGCGGAASISASISLTR